MTNKLMSIANLIREYVNSHYFESARRQGLNEISITSEKIHSEMGLSNSMPLVCSTLRGNKLEAYGVTLIEEIRKPKVKLNSSTNQFIFQIKGSIPHQNSEVTQSNTSSSQSQIYSTNNLDSSQFEERCRSYFSRLFNTQLNKAAIPGVPKIFDFVSPDNKIVGDAKYYSMVHGEGNPSAKLATISEYVWLLEKIPANYKFLVFGNDIRVPEVWLKKNGDQLKDIDFFFYDAKLDNANKITKNLTTPTESGLIKVNLVEDNGKSQSKLEPDRKWDPILDQFMDSKSKLVKVEVKGRDADYIYDGLLARIKARDLSRNLEVSIVNDITYLEKIDCREILEKSLSLIINSDLSPLYIMSLEFRRTISPQSFLLGYIFRLLQELYSSEFVETDEARYESYQDFYEEKLPIIITKIEEIENNPETKRRIEQINRLYDNFKNAKNHKEIVIEFNEKLKLIIEKNQDMVVFSQHAQVWINRIFGCENKKALHSLISDLMEDTYLSEMECKKLYELLFNRINEKLLSGLSVSG